ncbi:hypothetical protein EVAR_40195_1 [Eumeta japonica]|uniref:Uncharacterized protein n=1 Tax=Eumeta variegata TaxID=151549 RepID=A0A4C1XN23_EUMVA|nr:hypothetical protein EVAR_40195_1 [Eumeta japonica]
MQEWTDEGEEGTTATITHWTKCNSGSCYFTSVFCEDVVPSQSSGIVSECSRVGHSMVYHFYLSLPLSPYHALPQHLDTAGLYLKPPTPAHCDLGRSRPPSSVRRQLTCPRRHEADGVT